MSAVAAYAAKHGISTEFWENQCKQLEETTVMCHNKLSQSINHSDERFSSRKKKNQKKNHQILEQNQWFVNENDDKRKRQHCYCMERVIGKFLCYKGMFLVVFIIMAINSITNINFCC